MAKGKAKGDKAKRKELAAKAKLQKEEDFQLGKRKFLLEKELQISKEIGDTLMQRMEKLARKKHFKFAHGDAVNNWKLFVEAAQAKDNLISALLEESEECRNRLRISKQMQVDIVDELICLFDEQVQQISKEYFNARDKYVKEHFNFIMKETQRMGKKFALMDDKKYNAEEQMKSDLHFIKETVLDKHEMLEREELSRKEKKLQFLESEIACLWEEYKNTFTNYLKKSHNLRNDVTLLSINDANTRNLLSNLFKRVSHIMRKIELYSENAPWKVLLEETIDVKNEIKLHGGAYNMMQNLIKQNLEKDEKLIADLVKFSNDAIKPLNEDLKLIETLLKLMDMCLRYETEEEKVMSIGDEANEYFSDKMELSHFKLFRKLYYKRSQVAVQCEFLQKVYDEEKKETQQLKAMIECVIKQFDISEPEICEQNRICKIYKI